MQIIINHTFNKKIDAQPVVVLAKTDIY